MSYLKRGVCLIAAVLLVGMAAERCMAAGAKVDVLGSILKGNAELGKARAAIISAQATMVKAISQAQLDRAEAMQVLEQTRTVALDNRLKATTTFYEKRQLYEAYQSLQAARERPTREDLIRFSKESAPQRPVEYQLSQGEIHWPETLRQEEFMMHRIQLDGLFAKRTQANSGVGSEMYREVQTLTKQMRVDLKDMVQQVSPAEYLGARKFIEALAYEAQFPPDVPGVAVR